MKESFLFALKSLLVNKLRTFLSLLGITIGIFAIISVFTIVDSLESNIRKSVESLGTNVVFVQKWPWAFGSEYPWWKYMNRPVPALSELPEIQRRSASADAVAFTVHFRKTAKFRNNSVENADISAVSHDYQRVQAIDLENGRYFTEQESKSGKAVCILGGVIAESLFPGGEALGQKIKVGGEKLLVVGVIRKEGSSLIKTSFDNQVLLPVNFARNLIDLRDERMDPMIMVKAKPGISNEELKDDLTGVMRSLRSLKPMADDNFALNETSLLTQGLNGLFAAVGLAGWVIGGFSIIVGGFGIANIMFVSVKERTPIIGIEKSLGARNYFILIEFLVEAVVLSLVGGIIGLLLIFFGTVIANSFFDLGVSLSFQNIVMGLSVSGIIGVVSGFVPAYTASRLDPVVAMRS